MARPLEDVKSLQEFMALDIKEPEDGLFCLPRNLQGEIIMSSEVEVLGTFPNIEIVEINRPVAMVGRSRYHEELVSVHLSNGQDICFNGITDCCAFVCLRTDISEFKELIGKKLASLIFVKSEDHDYGGGGEYSTYYYYKFIFSDNTEFEFDFDGDHGNGGYYMAHVDVTISDVDGNVKEDE